MRSDGFYDSKGQGRIHYIRWTPEGPARAVLQILHGMGETAERYEKTAAYFNRLGYVVTAQEHMGHGRSRVDTRGYFAGGWMAAAEDCMTLLDLTRKDYGELPYALFGHSMGSFLLRTLLCRYPEKTYDAAILSGTGWHPRTVLAATEALCRERCRDVGEKNVSPLLNHLIFGSYNGKVEHRRTEYDWLTRDQKVVDAYLQDEDCGFPMPAGLLRDLMVGLRYIEDPEHLKKMRKDLPVLLTAGTMDPVGSYGRGVLKTEEAFRKAGMEAVDVKLYPLCRHEILNELCSGQVHEDLSCWLEKKLFKEDVL